MKTENIITGVKGFDKDLKCRDFQYEKGKEYETKEKPVRCTSNGFHFCENPLDVFNYYYPADSRFCEVHGSGEVSRDNSDTKIAVSKIKIGDEIGLHALIERGIKFIFERTKLSTESTNTENKKHASNSGDRGAAFSIGSYSSAETKNDNSFAVSLGYNSTAKGAMGSWLTLAEYNENYKIICVKSVKVDGKKIKEGISYALKNGKFEKL